MTQTIEHHPAALDPRGGNPEFGLDTFGDVTVDHQGTQLTQAETLRHVVEQGALADQVGLDFFCVGEHHRKDFSVSAPEVVLAAIASRSSRISSGRQSPC